MSIYPAFAARLTIGLAVVAGLHGFMRFTRRVGLAVALGLAALGGEQPVHAMQEHTVHAGVSDAPLDLSRIVTLGGSITEIVYALGLGDQVVASDRTSLYPASVMSKPRLDMLRNSSAEAIIAQRPSVVIASDALGPPAVRVQIQSAGVQLLVLEDAITMDRAIARLHALAARLGKSEQGQRLATNIQADLAHAASLQHGPASRTMFIYARGAGTVQVSGRKTAANTMIESAGGTNVFDSFAGYRPITAEAVVSAQPEVIVLPTRGLASLGGVDGLLHQPGISMTPAGRTRRIVTLDDALLLSFGPRVGEAVLALTRALMVDDVAGR